ncbi:MAG: hypothetical protein LBU37_00325 [Tannerellaceae bacterium]|jgi:hypothetical protein|nr:hypothetical protein [Tannerellaceae bacterium]
MEQKRKERPSAEVLLERLSRMLIPEEILKDFDIYGAEESLSCREIELREKEGLIPKVLRD